MVTFSDRLKHAWSILTNKDPTYPYKDGPSSYDRPDRVRLNMGKEKTIINSVYTRIAIDCCQTTIKHVRIDDNEQYIETINSGLNECLTVEANIDQTARAFMLDLVISMLGEGVVAIVPTETDVNLYSENSFDVLSMRVGKIVQWWPEKVEVELYNERTGLKDRLILPKKKIAIIENPFYTVMNAPNSTLSRLNNKIALLDKLDNENASGKLDMIIQLPYTIKTDARRAKAEEKRKDLEKQLSGSKYGIGYIDATERITQLNRPIDNNLLPQIEYLTKDLYAQLGLAPEIFSGLATSEQMDNYISRTIEPIISAIVDEMNRKFLTKTARTRNHRIMYFRNPFKFVSMDKMADISDRFTRNEIVSSNEIRQIIGLKASSDPKADELRNKNIADPNAGMIMDPNTGMSIDPNTGMAVDPGTGMSIDPNTGITVDPTTGMVMDEDDEYDDTDYDAEYAALVEEEKRLDELESRL